MANTPQTDTTGRIQQKTAGNGQPQQADRERTLLGTLKSSGMQAAIRRALPDQSKLDRAIANVATALNTTPLLAQCTPETFFSCVMQAAQLGLEVNSPMGEAYLIPRRNGKRDCTDCTLIIGYQGMISLAYRGNKVKKIWTRTVREGDLFKVKLGLQEDILHELSNDADRETRPIAFVYCVAQLENGEHLFEVLSKAQLENRKARSESAKSSFSPWKTDEEAMSRKSSVRALFRWLPKTSEMARVEELETRAEQARPQQFDPSVNIELHTLGLNPVPDDTIDAPIELPQHEHDPQTGESIKS